jgi:hypothetical protein
MLTFFSNSLSRQLTFEELKSLGEDDLKLFHEEVSQVVSTLNAVVNEAKAKERASGIALDANWLHKVNTKKRIALKFATEANSLIHGGTTVSQRAAYDRIYRAQFRATLLEEFDEAELRELEQEVLVKARAAYQAWIDSTNQRCWFVP